MTARNFCHALLYDTGWGKWNKILNSNSSWVEKGEGCLNVGKISILSGTKNEKIWTKSPLLSLELYFLFINFKHNCLFPVFTLAHIYLSKVFTASP